MLLDHTCIIGPFAKTNLRVEFAMKSCCRIYPLILLGFLSIFIVPMVSAQLPIQDDDTTLKQIIIFGRHGVRSPLAPNSTLQVFATRAYFDFDNPTSDLTLHGRQAEILLGQYYRSYLLKEGLLTGDSARDAKHSYFRSNSVERSFASAAAMAAGLLPEGQVPIYSFPLGQADAVFDPIAAEVVTVDKARAVQEVAGIFNNGAAVASANSAEYSLIRSALFDYPKDTSPPPPTPPGLIDPTALPIPLTVNTTGVVTGNIINAGGLASTVLAADPFAMEYSDNLPMKDVAWGDFTVDQVSQQCRIINSFFDIEMSTPYLNQLQTSNAASHILRTMQQAVTGRNIPGSFGDAQSRLLVINSSDIYVKGLADFLRVHWSLEGYPSDYSPVGGSLVFELRSSPRSDNYIVRLYFTSQTFNELRDLTPLTLDEPPASMQLLLAGATRSSSLDISFDEFERFMQGAINPNYVENPRQEKIPGPLMVSAP